MRIMRLNNKFWDSPKLMFETIYDQTHSILIILFNSLDYTIDL